MRHVVVRAWQRLAHYDLNLYDYRKYFPSTSERKAQRVHSRGFLKAPLISVLVPTYNTPAVYLRACIDSVLSQSYENWELCIADDASTAGHVRDILRQYAASERRIKLIERAVNGHICEATNSALAAATGEFVGLLDHDDILWPNALYEVVSFLNLAADVDLVYTDEDKLDTSGAVHSYPFLKPDWSPELLESCNYITHFTCIRRGLVTQLGGFRAGFEGAQDWDLVLRLGDVTQRIAHIPKILYSWRVHDSSTALKTATKPYVYDAQLRLLTEHVARINRQGLVAPGLVPEHRTIKYEIGAGTSLGLCIRYRRATNAARLLASLRTSTSQLPNLRCLCEDATGAERARQELGVAASQIIVCTHDEWQPALAQTTEDFLVFIDDSVEIVSDSWAETLLGDCQLQKVGMVGPVILQPDKTTVLSAGIGITCNNRKLINVLSGVAFDDPHYIRGLYLRSRRNVAALNPAMFAVRRDSLTVALRRSQRGSAIDLALSLSASGYRHVYTPHVRVVCHDNLPLHADLSSQAAIYDGYLNPNFNQQNDRLDVIGAL